MAESDEEPTLPPMPPAAKEEGAAPVSYAKRKRSVISHLFSDSSDVPVFSSDDDPAVENYTEGRRVKKRFAGPWFSQEQQTAPSPSVSTSKKRTLQRQVDSGVFMGSDASIDDILEHIPAPSTSRLPELIPAPAKLSLPIQPAQSFHPEVSARSKVQWCIDSGDETVDLSDMQLDKISNDTISLLSEFVAIPDVEKDVPFEQRDPSLKLFLFQNRLTRVPGAIFNLHHLTVLSLRGNQLTELPPSIRKLVNLRELNLSQNRLKFLPIELLELQHDERCSLTTLSLHPNPWYQPRPAEDDPNNSLLWLRGVEPPHKGSEDRGNQWFTRLFDRTYGDKTITCTYASFRARTPVEVAYSSGTGSSQFRIGRHEALLPTEDWTSEPQWPTDLQRPLLNKVPSLMELSLQACLRSPYVETLSDYLDPRTPRHVFGLLDRAQQWQETGGMTCSVCQRSIIKPTAQWIEWWQLYTNHLQGTKIPKSDPARFLDLQTRSSALSLSGHRDENLLPFIRRACSWQCVLDPVRGLGMSHARTPTGMHSEQDDKMDMGESEVASSA